MTCWALLQILPLVAGAVCCRCTRASFRFSGLCISEHANRPSAVMCCRWWHWVVRLELAVTTDLRSLSCCLPGAPPTALTDHAHILCRLLPQCTWGLRSVLSSQSCIESSAPVPPFNCPSYTSPCKIYLRRIGQLLHYLRFISRDADKEPGKVAFLSVV